MAVLGRLYFLLVFFLCYNLVITSPLHSSHHVFIRASARANNATSFPQVFNPNGTLQPSNSISQGIAASDGSGIKFSLSAITWIIFSFTIGLPMAAAGIRGWRLTIGVGIGLAMSVSSWAIIVNTVSAVDVSDVVITVAVITFFTFGLILGMFEMARIVGVTLLGVLGGLAFAMRIILLKDGPLPAGDHSFIFNWLVIVAMGILCGASLIWWQRISICFNSASVGTFLSALGLDLLINKQAGMSLGLRFLFDHNPSHSLDLLVIGYKAPDSTRLIIITSLVLTLFLTYVQHRFFPHPFSRKVEIVSKPHPFGPIEKQETEQSSMEGIAKLKPGSHFSM